MTRRLRPIGPALVLALLLPLVGCGGNDFDAYCGDLKRHQKAMSEMIDSGSPTSLLGHLSMLHELADRSPEDLADEWQTFLGALDHLDKALAKADVEPSDFAGGKPPDGLSDSERKAIAAAADQVSSEEVTAAAAGIEQEARDVCKVNLGL
jgi:hypothetical protein